MPRIARIDLEGYWYHVISRGQRKNPLFFSPADMDKYLELLNDLLNRFDHDLGAYCLMRNHPHLMIKRNKIPLSRLIHNLNTQYALYFNDKYNLVGHVFQSRPKCLIILDENYLYNDLFYIHRNPEKAGIVDDLKDYPALCMST